MGWQRQASGTSLQDVFEAAARTLADGADVAVMASGRTDAGVHAWRQGLHLDLGVPRTASAVRDGLNARLPRDVAVLEATPAPPEFCARRWVVSKRYRYRWLDTRMRHPWWDALSWHVKAPLDRDAMRRAAEAFVGTHDFESFRAAGCGATTTERTLLEVSLAPEGEVFALDVVGNGFLRHMVRVIAGTLTEVGHGRCASDAIPAMLAAKNRSAAGPTAPAHGLMVMDVVWGDRAHPWAEEP